MKAAYKYLIVVMVLAFSCRPDEFPEIGERSAILPFLKGTWSISSVIQIDNDAERKGYPLFAQLQNITEDFPYDQFRLTLNLNADDTPSTFTVELGDSPNIVGEGVLSGIWEVDDLDFPSLITFTDDSESTIQLGSLSELATGKLVVKVVRKQLKGSLFVPVVTYNYVLRKTE
jgi:hypothetical protein